MSAAPLLAVEDLAVAFKGDGAPVQAVRGVSFALPRAGTLALVGESGGGKSVLALALLGLLPATATVSGRVLWEGTDLVALPERDRQRWRGCKLGLVLQDPLAALNPVLTVGDQVAEGLRYHRGLGRRAAREAAVSLLAEVRLPDAAARARDYPHRLSGGMRQRALLAAALACGPELLIADEPTASLDVTVQAEVLDLMAELVRARGMALLFVTHNLALVPRVAERAAVMFAGRLVEMGPARAVIEAPAHPFTRALLAALPERWPLHGRLPAADAPGPDPRRPPPGCPYVCRCPHARPACADESALGLALADDRRVACLPEVAGPLARGEVPA